VPEHFRVTFIAAVSFFWLIILSTIASKARPSDGENEPITTKDDDCPLVDGQICDIEWE
jgi:hypothetical protein